MNLVAIMTCGPLATLALGSYDSHGPERDQAVDANVFAQVALPPRQTAALLMTSLKELLRDANLRWEDVSAVAVTNGPGSFTGVRVGLATAKGLVEASAIPLLAVSSLALLADGAAVPNACVVLDAGRRELYARSCAGDEMLLSPEALAAFAPGQRIFACEDAVLQRLPCAVPVAQPDASALLRMAAPLIAAGLRSDAAIVDANYLRGSAAEVRRAS